MRRSRAARLVQVIAACAIGLCLVQPRVSRAVVTTEQTYCQALVGTWRYIGGQRQRDELDTAIVALTDEMNFFIRAIARARMRDANRIPYRFDIGFDGPRYRVLFPGKRPISAPHDGTSTTWVDEYGEDVVVHHRIASDRLVQFFQGEDGSREIVYHVNVDGSQLTFFVTIRSHHLPRPLRYRLSFGRET